MSSQEDECIKNEKITQSVLCSSGQKATPYFHSKTLFWGAIKSNHCTVDNIYVDPLVQPISTVDTFGFGFLNAVEKIMAGLEGVHTMCGASNISYGLEGCNINIFRISYSYGPQTQARGVLTFVQNSSNFELNHVSF